MNKEERQAEKLRRQQNRIANKMLIPAPKKTVQSLKLLNFDPSGTFHFVEDRWIRIYEVYGQIKHNNDGTAIRNYGQWKDAARKRGYRLVSYINWIW